MKCPSLFPAATDKESRKLHVKLSDPTSQLKQCCPRALGTGLCPDGP